MEFHVHTPGPMLRPFIDHFWLVRAGVSPFPRQTLFPDGGVTALFNFGAPQGLVDRATGSAEVFRDCWVAGERTRPFLLDSPDGTHLAGIRFRPGGAAPFFRLPLRELTDEVVRLETLIGRGAADVHDELCEATAPAEVFQRLEDFLSDRLDRRRLPTRLIDGALVALGEVRTSRPVRELAQSLGAGERRLLREFERTVGIGPKLLHRILRFQRVIEAEDRLPHVEWARVASRCGYYDQAHLIRDFRMFTGTTPETYRRLRLEYPNYLPEL